MNETQKEIARACLAGAEENSMSFPQIVGTLMQAGFEGYAVDFQRGEAVYYLPDGRWLALQIQAGAVAGAFNADAVQAAIREAQALVPGYSYKGFCRKVMVAGCAGYKVSFSGRRALYFGRTAETHTELFP
jgi:uncharacterized protein YbcV (DUF1398 family)